MGECLNPATRIIFSAAAAPALLSRIHCQPPVLHLRGKNDSVPRMGLFKKMSHMNHKHSPSLEGQLCAKTALNHLFWVVLSGIVPWCGCLFLINVFFCHVVVCVFVLVRLYEPSELLYFSRTMPPFCKLWEAWDKYEPHKSFCKLTFDPKVADEFLVITVGTWRYHCIFFLNYEPSVSYLQQAEQSQGMQITHHFFRQSLRPRSFEVEKSWSCFGQIKHTNVWHLGDMIYIYIYIFTKTAEIPSGLKGGRWYSCLQRILGL